MDCHFTKVLREKMKGKNQSAVARELDIPKSLLNDWISAKRRPSFSNVELVYKLAKYFGMTLEELLIGEGAKNVKDIGFIILNDESRKYRIRVEKIE